MSTPLIVREFQFARDFRKIQWGATLWYNLMRAACAGLVLGILMFFFPQSEADRFTGLAAPLFWPVAYLIMFLPMGVVFSVLRELPFVGLLAAFFFFFSVAVGDPLVCLIHKLAPKLVPVDAPPLFSLSLVFWVLDAPEFSVAE